MEYFKTYYEDKNDKERVSVAFLDSQLRIIATKTMFSGTVDQSFLSDREIVKEALFHNAASAMLAHNHPGGSDTPSQADVTHTKRIQQALEAVGVRLLDHIIVAGDTAASLAADGYISVSSKVETKKYEFTGTGKNSRSVVLRQIRALRNFGSVKVGDLGGFIEKEDNLSHGGNAWVGGNAQVSGHAQISGNAQVFGNAKVSGHAKVFDNAMICDDVRIFDHAKVYHDAWIFGKTRIGGDRTICSPDDLAHELSENRGDLTSRTKRDRAQGAPKKTVEERSR